MTYKTAEVALGDVARAARVVVRLEGELDAANDALDRAMRRARREGWSLRQIADTVGAFSNVTVLNRTRGAA